MKNINVEHHYISKNDEKEKERRSKEIYLACVRIVNNKDNIYYKNNQNTRG